ncbi:MAG: DUF3524 domain-containing protein [Planctomycetota bacterium]
MALILVLEPFGGGSHATLYQGWSKYSRHELTVLELPAVHWKWRSRHASLSLAKQSNALLQQGSRFDCVFCSSMLNLPEWRGFTEATLQQTPAVVYFHENQFTYPISAGQQRDYHFAYNNVLTAIAANEIWFNSQYHLDEFRQAAVTWLRKMPDYGHIEDFESSVDRFKVLPPGIDPPELKENLCDSSDHSDARGVSSVPIIGWVSRWEHDKRPDSFLKLIEDLLDRDFDFRLILLGETFARVPPEYVRLLKIAGERILHQGYTTSRAEYWQLLQQMDFVLSTADHEFFGIGICEAIYAGAIPLLPDRLAYPELLERMQLPARDKLLYASHDELVTKIQELQLDRSQSDDQSWHSNLAQFTWEQLAIAYDDGIAKVVEESKRQ